MPDSYLDPSGKIVDLPCTCCSNPLEGILGIKNLCGGILDQFFFDKLR
jgi:hypothetical protein